MTFVLKILLLAFILLILLIGFRIYHLDTEKHLNRMFLFLCLGCAWVAFCEYELLKTTENTRAVELLSWMSLLVMNTSLITYITYLHLQRYNYIKNSLVQTLLHLYIFVPAFIFFYIHLYHPLCFYHLSYIVDGGLWHFTLEHNIYYLSFLLWTSINASLLSYFSYLAYCHSLTTYERSWNRVVFYCIGILNMIALSYYYFIFFSKTSILIYSTPFMFTLILGLAWAFSNFKLFEVTPFSAIQKIMDSSSNLMFLTDLSYRIQRVNTTAQEVLDLAPKDLLDQNITSIFKESQLDHLILDHNTLKQGRYVQINRLNQTQYFYLNISNIQNFSNQQITGYVYVATDITSLQKAQFQMLQYNQALQKVNDELEEFAQITSDVLQSPLKTVEKNVHLLSDTYTAKIAEEGRFYIQYALSASQRMQKLLNHLLQYSKIHQTTENFIKVSPIDIVQDKIADLYHLIQEKKAGIEVQNFPDLLYCQPQQLGIVFYNLLHNALKFNTHPQPFIQVIAQSKRTHYLFSVVDNGIGIPKEQKENIFMIFKRLHRKEDYEGTGLGLAMCRKIVERHGGKIWLETDVEKGSIFCFTIPKGRFLVTGD